MIFLGRTFCGARNTIDCTPTNVANINLITIKNGIYDEIYLSNNTSRTYTTSIPTGWDFDTALHATFQDNLQGGNVGFTLDQVSTLRVKRRELGTFDWTLMFEIGISTEEDLHFERFDRYLQSNVEYEYLVVPVLNGVEGTAYTNSTLSQFEGMFIIEKEQAFNTILDVEIQSQKNRPNSTVNTIDRKYPYVVSNGQNNYYSGSASGVFIELDYDNCQFKTKEGWQYREQLMEFLQNGKPKILKHDDGRMWLVAIVDNPSESASEHPDKVTTTFNWVEIGDCKSGTDLYDNNFIDVDQ